MAQRLFLERRTYRRNRLQDAARLLPILGFVLIFAPIFIRGTEAMPGAEGAPGLGDWLVYYFVVWVVLIILTALVSHALIRVSPDSAPVSDPTEDGG
ncbi:MAG: hypothetical protein RIB61_16575 [Roseicyclus sp.]|jgi:ABC-type transport system involved in cytochrome c biogenesis permease component